MKRNILLLLLTLISFSAGVFGQLEIRGVVTDNENQPLTGAAVMIKGTSQGTVTDIDGKYTLTVPAANSILVFSFVGYLDEEMLVGDQTIINLSLMPDISGLDEVVVVGYGTVKKRDLTAPVSSVSARQLQDIPLTSTAQALTGRLPGVQVTTTEGSPGAEVKIRIRGGGSITQDNSPLYIVNGLPVDDISDIPPTEIESIDILKDASAGAIYGARGANGVVIITTKGGTEGKLRINYNTFIGIKQLARKLDVLSPREYVLYQYERSGGSVRERRQFEDLYGTWEQLDSLYEGDAGTDWQDEVFGQDALSVTHNLNFTGGTEKSNYNLSYTNNVEDGIMIGSGFERNSLNAKFSTKASKRITIDFDARYTDLEIMGAGTSDPGKSSQNRLRHSVMYRPVDGLSEFSEEDVETVMSDDDYYSISNLAEPVQLTYDEYRKQKRITTNMNAALRFEIMDGLSYKTDVGYYERKENDDRFYGLTTYLARRYANLPVVQIEKIASTRLRWSNVVNFQKEFGLHELSLLAGHEMMIENSDRYSQEIQEFPEAISPEFAMGFLTLGNAPQHPYSYIDDDFLLSFFGRVNYSLNEKYLAQVSLRADGSKKFAQGNEWGYFPSGSFGWRISEEDFMENLEFISSMKLRASYGQAGNNRIDNNYFFSRFETSTTKPYFLNESEVTYLYRPDPYNPDIRWETTITRDIGLDLGLFRERLHATVDYYFNSTKDLLVEVPLDPSTGYTSRIENIGNTSNRGLEAALDAYIIDKKDFKLSVNFNIAFNKNRIDMIHDEYKEYLYTSDSNDNTGGDYLIREGEPLGLMYGFVTDGYYTVDDFEIDPETGEFLMVDENYVLRDGVADNQGIVFAGFGPGSVRFRNLTNPIDSLGNSYDDGSLVTFGDDRQIIGNSNPKHVGGFNISAAYKGLDMSIFMNWVYGNDIYNANRLEFTSGYYAYNNLLTDVGSDQRWMTVNEEGETVTNPDELAALNADASTWKPSTGRYLFHSWAVEDGSFLRINNITLGYTLPAKLLQKVYIQNLRVYVTVNNIYTFTNYSGYDPEVDTRRDTPMTPGVDYSAYPRSKMYLIGLNVTL